MYSFTLPIIALASALSFSNIDRPVAPDANSPVIHLRSDYWHGRNEKTLSRGLTNASRHLLKSFPMAEAHAWDRLADGSLLCFFKNKGKDSRAFFGPRGHWFFTIEQYAGNLLPENVAYEIRSVYGEGTEITSGNTILRPGEAPVYLAVIKTGRTPRRVRVDNDGVALIETFQPDADNACPAK